ncbi:MAG TPA: hypothetical protein VMR31_19015 [Myxococcota bacterium]|nr:hypothetical protein [Myxococcota bacterium]
MLPAKPQRLAEPQPGIQQQQHEQMRRGALLGGGVDKPGQLVRILDRVDRAVGIRLSAAALRACLPPEHCAERIYCVRLKQF